jgi:hypothetical protein
MLNPDSAEALVGEDVARAGGQQILRGGGEEQGANAVKYLDGGTSFFDRAKEIIKNILIPAGVVGVGSLGLYEGVEISTREKPS